MINIELKILLCVNYHLRLRAGPGDEGGGRPHEAEGGEGAGDLAGGWVQGDDQLGGGAHPDQQLVHDHPGQDEEDAGEDGHQGQDRVRHVPLLQQQQEVDHQVQA